MKRRLEIASRRPAAERIRSEDQYAARRDAMVERQIIRRGIQDTRVLAAMRRVPRHLFIPEAERALAYEDRPLPIGMRQTISQPYIVAFMTEALRLPDGARVLDVGTGSAYQAAVLAEIAQEVYSVEIVPALASRASTLLVNLGYENVEIAERDGSDGRPEHAPYDGILVAAAAGEIPLALIEQVKPGARLVIPVGSGRVQDLVLVTKEGDGIRQQLLLPVCFVPMTGRAQNERSAEDWMA
jgi:protein-L-isoaspartate(D-aspartate) O-methyltransferase